MTAAVAAALAQLQALADPAEAARAAAYHKAPRAYLGIRVPVLTAMARDWRSGLTLPDRVALAQGLWDSNIHEARVAAAKLMVQARLRDDGPAWDQFCGWVPDFDGWAIADHACDAGARRLVADPGRIDRIEGWVQSHSLWTRRAALVVTLPWTKQNHPGATDLAIRDRVLGWAATLAAATLPADRDRFIQKAIAWWLRDLSRHDPARVREWLAAHGAGLMPFARAEAGRLLPPA